MRWWLVYSVVVLAPIIGGNTPGYGAKNIDFQLGDMGAKIARLERQITMLERQAYGKKKGPESSRESGGASKSADNNVQSQQAQIISRIDSKVEEMAQQMRELKGKIEEVSHNQAQNFEEVSQQIQALQQYCNELQKNCDQMKAEWKAHNKKQEKVELKPISPKDLKKNAKESEAKEGNTKEGNTKEGNKSVNKAEAKDKTKESAKESAAAINPEKKRKEFKFTGKLEEDYNKALELLHNSQLEQAQEGFDSVIKRFPKDKLAANAQYWIGEIYYIQKNYPEACMAFLNTYKMRTKGEKAPEALYKLAVALNAMKKFKEAKTTLEKMKEEFPNPPSKLKSGIDKLQKELAAKA